MDQIGSLGRYRFVEALGDDIRALRDHLRPAAYLPLPVVEKLNTKIAVKSP